MKLIYKGKCKDINSLSKGTLPENAVRFKEPVNALQLNLVALLFSIPALLIIFSFIMLKIVIWGEIPLRLGIFDLWGVIFAFLCIIPHEFLHAICFPKDAEVEMYYADWGAFVFSAHPTTKLRFIMLSLCPNLIFGILPLIVWLFFSYDVHIANTVFSFGMISLLFGCGDYMNVFNALTQMPKGTYQQLSGFNSYWFYPSK